MRALFSMQILYYCQAYILSISLMPSYRPCPFARNKYIHPAFNGKTANVTFLPAAKIANFSAVKRSQKNLLTRRSHNETKTYRIHLSGISVACGSLGPGGPCARDRGRANLPSQHKPGLSEVQ